jgi:hypothetical protein
MNDIKSRLFISLAAGRFICGLCAITGILFTAWIVQAIGQTGISVQSIAATAGAFALGVLFTHKGVLDYSAQHPYWVLVINSTTFVIDGMVILLYGDAFPYTVIISGIISMLADKSYVQSRKVMVNRTYSGDELTILGNKLDIVGIVAAMAGSGIAIVVPCTTGWIGGLLLGVVVLLTIANYYQIKYLIQLQPKEEIK